MNRRRFLELMGMAVAGGTVAYSFPSIIVPKNLMYGLTMLDLAPVSTEWSIVVGMDYGYIGNLIYVINNTSRTFQGIQAYDQNS